MRKNLTTLGLLAALSVVALTVVASLEAGPPSPAQPPVWTASISVNLDRAVMAPIAISASDAIGMVSEFYRTHEAFTLEELQAMEITGREGAKVPLSKIATIEVKFGKATGENPEVR